MHPAKSVIAFTTLSGIGFGLLFWLGLGVPPVTGGTAFAFFVIAYLFAVGGLVASTTHLGNPRRAWRAFSQWRSSWLSREGCAAVAALLVMALFGFGLVFFGGAWAVLGLLGALLSLATVFTTSMIYAQLKTVPRWNQPLTPVLFLLLSLTGGAMLAGLVRPAGLLLLVCGAVQVAHWWIGDSRFAKSGSTVGSATGLASRGDVRLFEPPHRSPNYLTREMVFQVGRRHARKLRVIALVLMSLLPAVMLLLLPASHVISLFAVLFHLVGVAVSRWLFFAEAEHVVGLYYGRAAA